MTKTEWTAEEVRAQAKLERRDRGDVLTEAMLTAFAERIERAQAGVTDEIARKLGDEYFRICKETDHEPMQGGFWVKQLRAALQSVWPVAAERIAADESAVPVDADRKEAAIELAVKYGCIDGAHHKDWVIDQMVRVLAGDDYAVIVTEAKAGEDGPDTYGWNEGIAP